MRKTFAVIFAITFILSCHNSYCQGNVINTVKTDKGETFSYQILKEEQNNDYRVLYLSFPSPVKSQLAENNIINARYFIPNNINNSKRPAVITLPILNGAIITPHLLNFLVKKTIINKIIPKFHIIMQLV